MKRLRWLWWLCPCAPCRDDRKARRWAPHAVQGILRVLTCQACGETYPRGSEHACWIQGGGHGIGFRPHIPGEVTIAIPDARNGLASYTYTRVDSNPLLLGLGDLTQFRLRPAPTRPVGPKDMLE